MTMMLPSLNCNLSIIVPTLETPHAFLNLVSNFLMANSINNYNFGVLRATLISIICSLHSSLSIILERKKNISCYLSF